MSVDKGIDIQAELLHTTEKEYLELATTAQSHVNKLNSTISDNKLELKILNERVEFLTLELVKIGRLFQQYYIESVSLRIQLCKTTQESIQKSEKIIKYHDIISQLEEAVNKHKTNFKDAISFVSNKKRQKTD